MEIQENKVFQYTSALVTLAAVDIEKIVLFYTELLNQEPTFQIPNVYAEFQLSGLRLGIFKPKETHQQEFQNSAESGMSLCLEVINLENVIFHLTVLGYPPPGEIFITSHRREVYAYDPAGNRLIFHQSN